MTISASLFLNGKWANTFAGNDATKVLEATMASLTEEQRKAARPALRGIIEGTAVAGPGGALLDAYFSGFGMVVHTTVIL